MESKIHVAVVNEFNSIKDELINMGSLITQYKTNPAIETKKALIKKINSERKGFLNKLKKLATDLKQDRIVATVIISRTSPSSQEHKEALRVLNEVDKFENTIKAQLKIEDIRLVPVSLDWVDDEIEKIHRMKEEILAVEKMAYTQIDKILKEIYDDSIRLKAVIRAGAFKEKMNLAIVYLKEGLDAISEKNMKKMTPERAVGVLNYCKSQIIELQKTSADYLEKGEGVYEDARNDISIQMKMLLHSWNSLLDEINRYFVNIASADLTGKIKKELIIFGKDLANGGMLRL